MEIAFFYMKKAGFIFLLLSSLSIFSQDSLLVGRKYYEDQLYVGITFNTFTNAPDNFQQFGISSGLHLGFVKDIPFTKKGNLSVAIGAGYAVNKYKQNILLPDFTAVDLLDNATNSFITHAIEFPISFRLRTSTSAIKSFWRLYIGVKTSYIFSSVSNYKTATQHLRYYSIPNLNNWRFGPYLSVGYGQLNLYLFVGQATVFKNAPTTTFDLNTLKEYKVGLQFYIF